MRRETRHNEVLKVFTILLVKLLLMPEHIIQTKSLSFQYAKNRKVLDDISLNIPKGSIYGFLGPNGAGKSTTMRLLTGIIPEQGEEAIYLFNEPLKKSITGGLS
jgi:ABC-type multidrug transport system ATPase subunit